jgi:hypothetical protein
MFLQRKNVADESNDETAQKRPRTMPPEGHSSPVEVPESDNDNCSNCFDTPMDPESDSDNADDYSEIEIEGEDDVPHLKNTAALQNWLQLSDQHLASLHTSAAPSHRGNYHTTKVGKELSKRRQQELRKAEKDRLEREKKEDSHRGVKSSTIRHFFSPAARTTAAVPASDPEIESSNVDLFDAMEVDSAPELAAEEPDMSNGLADEGSNLQMDIGSSPVPSRTSPQPRATVEEIDDDGDDDGDDYIAVEPSQLSPEALAEEGLDELPWDPAAKTLPWETHSPAATAAAPVDFPTS